MRVSEKGHLTVLSVTQNKCDSEHAAHGVHGGAIPCHMVFTVPYPEEQPALQGKESVS